MPSMPKMTRSASIHDSRNGFTLPEVIIASCLVLVLAFCAYRGISVIRRSARVISDHVAAQGLCLRRYEQMRSIAFEEVTEARFPATEWTLNRLPGFGRGNPIKAVVSCRISDPISGPLRKKVSVRCDWTFLGRAYHEEIFGVVVDGYSTYSEIVELLVDRLCINPNLEMPAMFAIVGRDGETIYTWEDLDTLGTVEATSVLIHPGCGGIQTPFANARNRRIENSKVSVFSSNSTNPITVHVTKEDGFYYLHMESACASFSNR